VFIRIMERGDAH